MLFLLTNFLISSDTRWLKHIVLQRFTILTLKIRYFVKKNDYLRGLTDEFGNILLAKSLPYSNFIVLK